jgi:hypothetical protein
VHATFSRLHSCVYNARQYSVVKDLDCLSNRFNPKIERTADVPLVGLGGIEPPTSPLSGVRSSHLSYRPRCLPHCSVLPHWWSWSGSNRRPPECKSGALPAELQPPELQGALRPPGILIEASWMQRPGVQPPAASEILSDNSKWRSGTGSPPGPKPRWRFGVERLFPTRAPCTLNRTIFSETPPTFSLRKEVIQPQVLLRLPCYDFTPIMNHTLGRCSPCGSACRLLVQSTFVM